MTKTILLLMSVLVALDVQAQERSTDPLGPLVKCINNDEFHTERTDRLPLHATSRAVLTPAGEMRVTTADGYRLMMYRKSTSPLVNLKLERSAEGAFSADREAIKSQMEGIVADVKPPHQMRLEQSTLDGIEILAVNNPSIDRSPGVISFYTLLDARHDTVATAYMLNQWPEIREFSTDSEYAALRDRFIAALCKCLSLQDL